MRKVIVPISSSPRARRVAVLVIITLVMVTGIAIGHVTTSRTVTIVCTQTVSHGQSYLNNCFYR
jgi:hypothetical protein